MGNWKNIALALLAAVVGLEALGLGLLVATGRLTGEKLERIARVMQNESDAADGVQVAMADTKAADGGPASASDASDATSAAEPAEAPAGTDRRDADMADQMIKGLKIQAELALEEIARREAALRKAKQAWEQQRKREMSEKEKEGHEAMKRILDTMRPRDAKRYLMEWPENVVVRLLRDMDDRKVGRILAECKTPEEQQKAAKLVMLLRQGDENLTRTQPKRQ